MINLQSDLQIQKTVDAVRANGFLVIDDLDGFYRQSQLQIEALGLYEHLDAWGNEVTRRVIALRQGEYNAIRPIYLTDKEIPHLSEVACGPSLFLLNDLSEDIDKFNQRTSRRGKHSIRIIARI